MSSTVLVRVLLLLVLFWSGAAPAVAQIAAAKGAPEGASAPPTSNLMRGAYGPERANNDLLHYTLDVRVDPVAKTIRGTNTIRFRMLQDGSRIQLDLTPTLQIDSVRMHGKDLKFERAGTPFFVSFPKALRSGKTYEIAVGWSGAPQEVGRFGGVVYGTDPQGKPWIFTSCEDDGASIWWPNKDQWRDEPQEGVDMHVAVPNGLTAVSNGRLLRSKDLHNGYTRWDWRVTYPINNYDVSLNVGRYAHWGDKLLSQYGNVDMDFYVQPENLAKAHRQFAQAGPMLHVFEKYFGPYPFARDGYKLVEVPYAGMEHQSAVAYGNGFKNSYQKPDWLGVGISPRFDFIIVHESGHEWFGNSVSAADPSDMWIQEGFCTYMEDVYVEAMYGYADAVKYINAMKSKVYFDKPVLQPRGENRDPSRDQYFKGALLLNTLRSAVNDDAKWWATLHNVATHFAYRNILTDELVAYMNQQLGHDYTPVFDAYLKYTALPALELRYHDVAGTVDYRWDSPVAAFHLPVRVGDPQHWTTVEPRVGVWQTTAGNRATFAVDTNGFYLRTVQDPGTAAGKEPSTAGWKLVWRDEFNAPDGSPIDAAKWNVEEGGNGWGNNELETYTGRHNNVEQRGGNLEITARREDFTGKDGIAKQYTSARVNTQGKFAQKYGRVEARIKLPAGGQGVWPAFWMLGEAPAAVKWPDMGELDIMEQIGKEPGTVHGTLHGPGYAADSQMGAPFNLPAGKAFSDDWHVFAVEWEPAAIRFYVDGTLYATETRADMPDGATWAFDHPFFLILNLAVGGAWPGAPDATTKLPATMQVDWVRVWERI